MAYKKYGKKYRARKKFKASRRPASNAGVIALAKINRMQRQQLFQVEKKYFDINAVFDVSPIASLINPFPNFTLTDLAPITQGDTTNQRIGDKVTVKSLKIRISPGLIDDNANYYRCMVIQWTSPAVLVPSQVLQTTGGSTTLDNLIGINYKANGQIKYKVLYDKTLCLTNSGYNQIWHKWLKIKGVKNMPLHWTDTTGTSHGGTSIWLLEFTTSIDNATLFPIKRELVTRLTYTDQ